MTWAAPLSEAGALSLRCAGLQASWSGLCPLPTRALSAHPGAAPGVGAYLLFCFFFFRRRHLLPRLGIST